MSGSKSASVAGSFEGHRHGAFVPPSMRKGVFKPFPRNNDARNQGEGGRGLGLPMARDIARWHGGDITFGDSPQRGLRAAVRVTV
jgi:two-component system, OmpR family, osmolarity sensor histidine kinase EnvZ